MEKGCELLAFAEHSLEKTRTFFPQVLFSNRGRFR